MSGGESPSCDRCGADSHPENALPMADYRTLTGEDPVLCDRCRGEFIQWVQAGGEQA